MEQKRISVINLVFWSACLLFIEAIVAGTEASFQYFIAAVFEVPASFDCITVHLHAVGKFASPILHHVLSAPRVYGASFALALSF